MKVRFYSNEAVLKICQNIADPYLIIRVQTYFVFW